MQKLEARLKRIIGQINGIIKMMNEEKDCEKVIIQFQAAKAALDSAFSEALNENLEKCITNNDPEKMQKIIKLLSKK